MVSGADYGKLIFSGQRRVFFLLLTFVLLAQTALFLQDRMQKALVLINEDFKVAVSLNNASAGEAAVFKNSLAALAGVRKVKEISPAAALESLGAQGFSADLLPKFYEIAVDTAVMLNPKVWVQNNIAPMPQDASVYYKEDQAKLAVYIDMLARTANILLAAALFALLSFGFFVEAYYTQIADFKERSGGVLAALFAFAIAWGALYFMTAPADKVYPGFAYDLFSWRQAALLAAALLTGWTLAKWKRF